MILVKLNIQPDQPTINDRIYSDNLLDDAFKKVLNYHEGIGVPILNQIDINTSPKDIYGYVHGCQKTGNTIYLKCELLNKVKITYENLIGKNIIFASICAHGTIKSDRKTINDLDIINFFFTKEAPLEVINAPTLIHQQTEDILKPQKPVMEANPRPIPRPTPPPKVENTNQKPEEINQPEIPLQIETETIIPSSIDNEKTGEDIIDGTNSIRNYNTKL